MIAHKAVEAIDLIIKSDSFNDYLVKRLICLKKGVIDSIKFEFDTDFFPPVKLEYIKLPFSRVYYEFKSSDFSYNDVFHAKQLESSIVIDQFLRYENGHIYPTGLQVTIAKTMDGYVVTANGVSGFTDKLLTIDTEVCVRIANKLLACNKILACSNIIYIDNPAPVKLNKKRTKKGKQPLFSYKTLHIKISENAVNKNHQGGTHASPRVHLRRGHVRTLDNGKSVWVQPCMVGSKEFGMVHKDYKVEL